MALNSEKRLLEAEEQRAREAEPAPAPAGPVGPAQAQQPPDTFSIQAVEAWITAHRPDFADKAWKAIRATYLEALQHMETLAGANRAPPPPTSPGPTPVITPTVQETAEAPGAQASAQAFTCTVGGPAPKSRKITSQGSPEPPMEEEDSSDPEDGLDGPPPQAAQVPQVLQVVQATQPSETLGGSFASAQTRSPQLLAPA